jgi:tRNA (guanine37-N1)-methyltransferase
MTFHIITIFPHIFDSYFNEGIIRRARDLKGNIDIKIYDLREYTTDKHRTVDDAPFGGGPGMVLKIEPIFKCLEEIKKGIKHYELETLPADRQVQNDEIKTILFSAKGKKYVQKNAAQYSQLNHLIMICGRYEGVDERVAQHLVDEEVSIGDYVLTGGEIPAMAVVDSVCRLIPGVLGNPDSLACETHSTQENTDYPVYTRPEKFNDWAVPKELLSGNHKQIEDWRAQQQKKTLE